MAGSRMEVPDEWKYPVGPYRQAPAEYGGEWWWINPFSGEAPWLRLYRDASAPEDLPEGFAQVFGERPVPDDYPSRRAWQLDLLRWDQAKKNFKQAGPPSWAGEEQLQLAAEVLAAWGLGRPSYYEHADWGWMARFPESQIEEFEMTAHTSVFFTHLVVANYQIRLVQQGITPERKHPLIGSAVWPQGA